MDNKNIEDLGQILQLFEFRKLFIFLLGLLFIIILAKSLNKLAGKAINYLPSKRLGILQITTIIIFLIYIVGTAILFNGALRPSRELMLAISGAAAVAIGLSLKDLAASLVSGIILLFNQPFQVGDKVKFNNIYGEIKSIGLITVRLVTLSDDVVTIPNSRFLTDVVSSSNSGNMEMMIENDFYLALNADLKLAQNIAKEILITSNYIYLKKPFSILINEVKMENMIVIEFKVKAYVLDIKYEKLFQNNLSQRIISGFNNHKIARPLNSVNNLI